MQFLNRQTLATFIGAAALVVASGAGAASAYHPTADEAGAEFNPDHATTKSRDAVNAELAAAMKKPAWQTHANRGIPWPVAKAGEGRTRAEVNAELEAAMKQPAWDRVSRSGAAWPPTALASMQSSAK